MFQKADIPKTFEDSHLHKTGNMKYNVHVNLDIKIKEKRNTN